MTFSLGLLIIIESQQRWSLVSVVCTINSCTEGSHSVEPGKINHVIRRSDLHQIGGYPVLPNCVCSDIKQHVIKI